MELRMLLLPVNERRDTPYWDEPQNDIIGAPIPAAGTSLIHFQSAVRYQHVELVNAQPSPTRSPGDASINEDILVPIFPSPAQRDGYIPF